MNTNTETSSTNCPTCSAPTCPDCGRAIEAVIGNDWLCRPCVGAALEQHREALERTYGKAHSDRAWALAQWEKD